MGWPRSDVMDSNLRELMVAAEAREISEWDRQSLNTAAIENLGILVGSMFSRGNKADPVTMYDYHPYRKKPSNPGMTRDQLKAMGEAFKRLGLSGKKKKRS